jgi:hypothetical protein
MVRKINRQPRLRDRRDWARMSDEALEEMQKLQQMGKRSVASKVDNTAREKSVDHG